MGSSPRSGSRAPRTVARGKGTRRPGDRIGRFEIISHIASGGMGEVYLARSVSVGGFERLVAVKMCHPHLTDDAEFVTMFLDEARIAAAIHHPHVVATLDVGDDDGLYMVMEYVEGATLAHLIKEHPGTIPIPLAVRVMVDALRGLHAAHEVRDRDGKLQNLIHRDVTPQNILVGLDGLSRLTDFGVAKAEARATITREGSVKGKLGYLAPEQLRGLEIDRRVDIFAAGVVLWEALTGRRAFRGVTDADTVAMVLTAPIHPPSSLRSEIPSALDEVVLRALARDRDKRFATADELAGALERAVTPAAHGDVGGWLRAAAGDEIAARRVPCESDPTDVAPLEEISRIEPIDPTIKSEPPPARSARAAETHDEGALATLEPPRRSGRALLVGVIGGALLLGSAAAYFTSIAPTHERSEHEHPPTGAQASQAGSPVDRAEAAAGAPAPTQAAQDTRAEDEGATAAPEPARTEADVRSEARPAEADARSAPAEARPEPASARASDERGAAAPSRRGRAERRHARPPAPEQTDERSSSPREPQRTGPTRFEPLAP